MQKIWLSELYFQEIEARYQVELHHKDTQLRSIEVQLQQLQVSNNNYCLIAQLRSMVSMESAMIEKLVGNPAIGTSLYCS